MRHPWNWRGDSWSESEQLSCPTRKMAARRARVSYALGMNQACAPHQTRMAGILLLP
jgi:hypothetical protein